MYNQTRFVSAVHFFVAAMFLFSGLLFFQSAQTYNGLENSFMADNWGLPLAFLLTILFALGWWFVSVIENLILTKGRNAAIFPLVALLSIYVLILTVLSLSDQSFLQNAIGSSDLFLLSGSFFRFAVIRPEVTAKLQARR
jgi:hypothetical protein